MIHREALRPILLLALAAAACGPAPPAPPGRGVLVVVIDALRYDHLSGTGYDRDTTPALHRFEEECVTFRDAWAASPTMVPSHATLMTGCDPLLVQRPPEVLSDGSAQLHWIPAGVPHIADEFVARGFSTAAFSDHPYTGAMRGFDRGFQRFSTRDVSVGESPEPGLDGSWARFVRWVRGRDADEDWFAYLHANDLERVWGSGVRDPGLFEARAELDYVPPCGRAEPILHAVPRSRWRSDRTLGDYEALYDGWLSLVDDSLARVFAILEEEGLWEHTTVVVTGSYGIGFGESGFVVAGGGLSEVDLHVPLMIRPAPGSGVDVDRLVDTAVGLIDVAPTVLALADIPAPAGMHGQSLLPLMHGRADRRREFTFATAGVYDGFAAIGDSHLYELFRPAARRNAAALASSWFGVGQPDRMAEVEILVERGAGHAPRDPGGGVRDRAAADRMRAAATRWYEGVRRVQRVVHLLELDPERVDRAEVDALLAEGLLGPQD